MHRPVTTLPALLPALLLLAVSVAPALASEPIRLHPQNRRIFEFRGQPTVLITSGEHYGAIINADFDQIRYLDHLQRYGFNLTRVFGSACENWGAPWNTLNPAAGRTLMPWARSGTPGYVDGGNKFDLNRFDDAYWQRARTFMQAASDRGIVVEFTLFNTVYRNGDWAYQPFASGSNINGVGGDGESTQWNLNNAQVMAIEEAYVRKAVAEFSQFDNVYLELCNEPYIDIGPGSAWHQRLAQVIADAQAQSSRKLLVAINYANGSWTVPSLTPGVSLLNFHYCSPPRAVADNYHHERPVCFDESGFRGTGMDPYRREAWQFLVAGGAVYDGLDWTYEVGFEDGTGTRAGGLGDEDPALWPALQALQQFMRSFDLAALRRAPQRILSVNPAATVQCSAKPGQQVAIHVEGGTSAGLQTTLDVDLEAGTWQATWVSTRDGSVLGQESFAHAGGGRTLVSPVYDEDIALKLLTGPGPAVFPLRVAAGGRHLVDGNGQPFFYSACTGWQIFWKLTEAEAEDYLDNRAAKGFTALQLQLLPHRVGDVNRYGENPFLAPGDLLRPNPAYFDRVHRFLAKAEAKGLAIMLAPNWLAPHEQDWRHYLTNANADAWGRWLAETFRQYENVMWMHGGDISPGDLIDETRQVAAAIDTHAPAMLQTYHDQNASSSWAFHHDTWLDWNSGYDYDHIWEDMLRDYNLTPVKPVYLSESHYDSDWGHRPRSTIRRQAWYTIMAGGCGHAYGHTDLWKFSPAWRTGMEAPSASDMTHFTAFFRSRPWQLLVPDQQGQLLVGGQGGGEDWIGAGLTPDRSLGVVYIPYSKTFTVNLGRMAGQVAASWFDPTSGSLSTIGTFANSGNRDFTPPSSNAANDGSDFVLVLSVGGGDPGNTAPTISDLADQSATVGQTASVAVSVADAETAAGSLTLTATSADQTVLPDSALVLGGSGGSRTLTLTPAAAGTAVVTVTVTDAGGLTASRSFTLTAVEAGPAPAQSWTSHAVGMQAGSPQARVVGSGGTVATVLLYQSTDADGVQQGSLFSTYSAGTHPDGFNAVAGYWANAGGAAYPYAGKSTVGRGSGAGEANAAAPLGVMDLQLHPPSGTQLAVCAFVAPVAGDYRLRDLGLRRVHNQGGSVLLRVFGPDRGALAGYTPLRAVNDQDWVRDAAVHDLGALSAGDRIHVAVDHDGDFGYDASEVSWTVELAAAGGSTRRVILDRLADGRGWEVLAPAEAVLSDTPPSQQTVTLAPAQVLVVAPEMEGVNN